MLTDHDLAREIVEDYSIESETFIPVEEFLQQVPDFIMDPEDAKFLRNYDD